MQGHDKEGVPVCHCDITLPYWVTKPLGTFHDYSALRTFTSLVSLLASCLSANENNHQISLEDLCDQEWSMQRPKK